MAHSSDISSTVAASRNSRYDENLPEHYSQGYGQGQYEMNQHLSSPEPPYSDHAQSWCPPHSVYVLPGDQNPKEHYASETPYYENEAGRRPVKILGLRRRTFFIVLGLLVLIVIGAVLGGVLGSRAANDSDGNNQAIAGQQGDSSSTGAPPSATVAPTSSSTSSKTSSAAPSATSSLVVDKTEFKFPSIAITHTGNRTHMFSLRASDKSISHWIKTVDRWVAQYDLEVSNVPAAATALTIISWAFGGGDQLRLYYIDMSGQVVELAGDCTSSSSCEWTGHSVISNFAASKASGVAALHWGNNTSANGDQIRLYYANEENVLYEQIYDLAGGGWADAKTTGYSISEGTGLSGLVQGDDDSPLQRLFFVDENGDVKCLKGEEDLTNSNVDFTDQSTEDGAVVYNFTRASSLTSCVHYGGDLLNQWLSIKQISESGDIVEAYQNASQAGGYWVVPVSNCPQGDDPGGAIAAVGYIDEGIGPNQLFVYTVGGAVTECWWHNVTVDDTWQTLWESSSIFT